MGWGSGSTLMDKIIHALKPEVKSKPARKKIYKLLIEAFEDQDCDTLYECVGQDEIYDELWEELYPEEE